MFSVLCVRVRDYFYSGGETETGISRSRGGLCFHYQLYGGTLVLLSDFGMGVALGSVRVRHHDNK